MRKCSYALALAATLWLAGCARPSSATSRIVSQPATTEHADPQQVHLNGTIQPIRYVTVQVPQIAGQGGRQTLTRLIPNGSKVNQGDLLAEFDQTQQSEKAREAKGKYEDLAHQVDQKRAQNRSDAEKRLADLAKAEADLAKAEIQLRKGPLLAEIDRLKAEVKLEDARAHVGSLKKSNAAHDAADAAALRILELQRDRQKVGLERALNNTAKLQLRSPFAGMVAHENVWRNNSMGHPQEGDQLWSGQPLIRIFDPSGMEVQTMVGEPDGPALVPGTHAKVRLDAYPELVFDAHFDSASPAAASAIGSPIKTFSARFRLEKSDPHLLPDLTAAVVLEPPAQAGPQSGGAAK